MNRNWRPFMIYQESDNVFSIESPFYLVSHDDRSRAKKILTRVKYRQLKPWGTNKRYKNNPVCTTLPFLEAPNKLIKHLKKDFQPTRSTSYLIS